VKDEKLSVRELTRDFLPRTPFNGLLGMRVRRAHDDGLTIECQVRDDLKNAFGAMHGGVMASLADAAVGMALYRHTGGRRPAATVELKINYFRPVTEGRLIARARLLRVGSTLCVGSVELTDAKKRSIGAALVTYMFLDVGKHAE